MSEEFARPTSSGSPSQTSTHPTSRRQRLMGFARATRDTYLPRITNSVSSMTSNIGSKSIEYDEFGMLAALPQNTQFTLYPSYTRKVGNKYVVNVRGWMWCPGTMSRKNRLVISLAKQVTRSNDDTAQVAVDRLEHDPKLSQDVAVPDQNDSDSISISTSTSGSSSASAASPNSKDMDVRLRGRLSSFLARSIPNAGLAIVVGAVSPLKDGDLRMVSVVTDPNGHFKADIEIPYEPSVIQVKSKLDETVCAFQEVSIVETEGYGVISDIDDTVKLTGVVGEKRELMRRLLLGDIDSWELKPVVSWFNQLSNRLKATFHYVSNSPWQLYSTIQEYFHHVGLPSGSFHLKQYTGNIMSSLMEPSSSKKRSSLSRILEDFPKKQFICVGDSGEHDFEAYVDLAKSYPGQVRAIYIRAVDDSLSDVDDNNILTEIHRSLKVWKSKQPSNHVASQIGKTNDFNLIDLSDSSMKTAEKDKEETSSHRLRPMIPKKPASLKGRAIHKAPPLPERRYLRPSQTDTELIHKNIATRHGQGLYSDRAPSPASSNESDSDSDHLSDRIDVMSIHGNRSFYELEDYDKKGALWLQRLTIALKELDGKGVDIAFFNDNDEEFFLESLQSIEKHSR
ncbi:hypothetical protein ACI3L0_004209 [Candidozyma auris]